MRQNKFEIVFMFSMSGVRLNVHVKHRAFCHANMPALIQCPHWNRWPQCMTNYIWLEALSNYHWVNGLVDDILRQYIDTGYFYNAHSTPQIDYHLPLIRNSQFIIVGNIDFWYAKKIKACLVVFVIIIGELRVS